MPPYEWAFVSNLYVTRPAKINHVNTKNNFLALLYRNLIFILTEQNAYYYARAWNNSRPSAIFRPFSGIWLSKSNLLGQIYYAFSMEKSIIVYKMFLLLVNGRPISNPYFKLCTTLSSTSYRNRILQSQLKILAKI